MYCLAMNIYRNSYAHFFVWSSFGCGWFYASIVVRCVADVGDQRNGNEQEKEQICCRHFGIRDKAKQPKRRTEISMRREHSEEVKIFIVFILPWKRRHRHQNVRNNLAEVLLCFSSSTLLRLFFFFILRIILLISTFLLNLCCVSLSLRSLFTLSSSTFNYFIYFHWRKFCREQTSERNIEKFFCFCFSKECIW